MARLYATFFFLSLYSFICFIQFDKSYDTHVAVCRYNMHKTFFTHFMPILCPMASLQLYRRFVFSRLLFACSYSTVVTSMLICMYESCIVLISDL